MTQKLIESRLPTEFGDFRIIAFSNKDDHYSPHLVLISDKKDIKSEAIFVRIHSECITGDLFTSKRCDCGEQLTQSMKTIGQHGGALIYLRQEGRGIGIVDKLKAYNLQDQGIDTFEANQVLGWPADARDYSVAVDIIRSLEIKKIKLLTNNPEKLKVFENIDLTMIKREKLIIPPCTENYEYLIAKQFNAGHDLGLKNILD